MEVALSKNKKCLIYLPIVTSGLFIFMEKNSVIDSKMWLSDLFFCISISYLIYGIWSFVLKIGFFNGFFYGMKKLKGIVFQQFVNESDLDYFDYLEGKNKKVNNLYIYSLILAGSFLLLSILFSIFI